MKQNYELTIHRIENEVDEKEYTRLIFSEFKVNPFYFVEHLKYFTADDNKLMYFLLKKDNKSSLIMPIILRQIIIKGKKYPYFDAVSPYGYSGPLFDKETTDDDYFVFWKLVDAWYKKNNIIAEFIRFSLNDNHKKYSGDLLETLNNIKGKLKGDFENQWSSFLPKVRNNYRKAQNCNLTFKLFEKEDLSEEVIKIFSDIYFQTMSRNNASQIYFFEKEYFEDLIIKNLGSCLIAMAYYKRIPVSTELIIDAEDVIFAYLGGTNSEYFSYRPNDFLRVKIIEWAITRGKKHYVLGGGIKNGDGLYKSKKALFPKDEDIIFYTGRKILNQKKYDDFSLLTDAGYETIEKKAIGSYFFPYYRHELDNSNA